MALVNCKECGMQVSTKANACPHCGAPIVGTVTTVPKYAAGCEEDSIRSSADSSNNISEYVSICKKISRQRLYCNFMFLASYANMFLFALIFEDNSGLAISLSVILELVLLVAFTNCSNKIIEISKRLDRFM